MPLSAISIKSAKPKEKAYQLSDGRGLLLEISPKGLKSWRFRFSWEGKQQITTLGNFPDVTLSQARDLAMETRAKVREGVDPRKKKKPNIESLQIQHSFNSVFEEWFAMGSSSWSKSTSEDLYQRCQNHLIPFLGARGITDITPRDMIDIFKAIEARGTLNMLKKVRGYASRIFRFGVGMGYCAQDPTRDIPLDIFQKEKTQHYASINTSDDVAALIRMINGYQGWGSIKLALQLAPHVFLRPSELAGLRWSEVDFTDRLLRIDADRMKLRKTHLVPLSAQSKKILRSCESIKVGSYVFPSIRYSERPINAESLRAGLRRLGITKEELTTHGIRHMASTILHEQGWPSDAIERQLAHSDKNQIRGTYNQAEYLDKRREMMQAWSNWLTELQ